MGAEPAVRASGLAATKPDVLTALGRIFAEEVERVTKRLAGVAGGETGSISFPQRFGGSLNVHVHYHLLAIDGCFEKQGEGVRMHEAPPPAKTDVAEVARRVHDRALAWLRKRRYLDERPAEERGNDAPERLPLDAFAALALAGGTLIGRPFAPRERAAEDLDRKEPRFSATHHGFDVHCAVRIEADDNEGRERLIRYCARPPFARSLLVRYPGVFAARSSWRALVTPKPADGVARRKKPKACTLATAAKADAPPGGARTHHAAGERERVRERIRDRAALGACTRTGRADRGAHPCPRGRERGRRPDDPLGRALGPHP
jgi:hypothetical protein